MPAFYNEIDPKAAAWLRELIKAGLIADGEVDERDIQDIRPADLSGFTQCHFFAGIGVWSYALRCAGWPDDRSVWTGSCPCQPFSAAGKGGGFDDERHLWPAFHYLIEQCRPPVVLGEQVASKDGLGWLDLVQADLEGSGYAAGAVDLCAAGVGAPHIRQRLWWVGERLEHAESVGRIERRPEPSGWSIAGGRGDGRVVDALGERGRGGQLGGEDAAYAGIPGETVGVAQHDDPERRADLPSGHDGGRPDAGRSQSAGHVGTSSADGGLADANGGNASEEREQRGREQRQQPQDSHVGRMADAAGAGHERRRSSEASNGRREAWVEPERLCNAGGPGPTNGLWRDADWLFCRDGKWRPVEPGTFPLAHGASERVGRLRGYGNAIVAPAAQAFIEAYLEAEAMRAAACT